MENLKQALIYTDRKKTHQLKKENLFFIEPSQEIKAYLNGTEDDSSVGLNLEYLSYWYHWKFLNDFAQHQKVNTEHLAKSTHFAIESNVWRHALGILAPSYDAAVQFNFACMHLGQLLYLGWKERAIRYGKLLLKMLEGKQYNNASGWPSYPWFILQLFCKWQGIANSGELFNVKIDLGLYQKAIDLWDTKDATLLSEIISQLSDYHIAQADENVMTDHNGNEFSHAFSSSDYFIFPVEILTWLAIRNEMNLPAYPAQNNGLMSLAINHLPQNSVPEIEMDLAVQCRNKLKNDNPGLHFGC